MWRHLYSLLLTLLLPALIWHVVRKYRSQGQTVHLGARLGIGVPRLLKNAIWIHACSLGEAKVALRLAESIQRRNPEQTLFFTATTPTGVACLEAAGQSVAVFPWDLPWVWRAWLRQSPRALVVIETELWPNLIAGCAAQQIPVLLANGRLSDKSYRRYQRFRWLFTPMWSRLSAACMQFKDDAARARALGVSDNGVYEVGSIKLDQTVRDPDSAIVQPLIDVSDGRTTVVLMSSHAADEEALFDAFGLGAGRPALLIVPRHPHRGAEIEAACVTRNLTAARLSKGIPERPVDVLIGDVFGCMPEYLSVADCVVIGGSLSGKGGQNPVEPALLSKPLVAGPSMYNFQAISDALEASGGLKRTDANQLGAAIEWGLSASARTGAEAACQWVHANRGSADRQAALIVQFALASPRRD